MRQIWVNNDSLTGNNWTKRLTIFPVDRRETTFKNMMKTPGPSDLRMRIGCVTKRLSHEHFCDGSYFSVGRSANKLGSARLNMV